MPILQGHEVCNNHRDWEDEGLAHNRKVADEQLNSEVWNEMVIFSHRSLLLIVVAIPILISGIACNHPNKPEGTPELILEASPIEQGEGGWKIATSPAVNLSVIAPGAQKVRLLYRPIVAKGRYLTLKTLTEPSDPARGLFSAEWKAAPDFAGHLWAEISYPDGAKKNTESIALTTEARHSPEPGQLPLDHIGPSVGTDESERSDKLTGGKIEQTSLVEGEPRLWITVNVPAFRLTLWQNEKEVKTYQIGVGRKSFPIRIGECESQEMIWNPEWVPPDSSWVFESEDVEPGERIEADDPRNPLGKLKIPLGGGYLIHQAAKPSDIGRLVSHGCIRMLADDLFDLTEKIVAARKLPVTREQIEQAKVYTDRLAVKLDPPLWVDINYDTQVVEGGVLHLYPDVYSRDVNRSENLRSELQSSGVDVSKLDPQMLKQMIDRVNMKEEFVVSIAELKEGRALIAGQNQPLTDYSIEKKPRGKRGRPAAGG
jgi:lipoprotein-anchoring transpeptidase ErfK/SrfK